MLKVEVQISGDKEIIASLKKLGQSFYMFDNAMREIGNELKSYFSGQVFSDQGEPLGSEWQPLTKRYATRKAKEHPGHGLLIASGTMQKSFYSKPTSTSVIVGNNDEKFEWHQLGLGHNPKRQMIGVNDDVKNIVMQVVQADIDAKIAKAGL